MAVRLSKVFGGTEDGWLLQQAQYHLAQVRRNSFKNLKRLEPVWAMATRLTVAIISAAAAIVVPAIGFYLTKGKERRADCQRYEFDLYEELVQSLSGIVGNGLKPQES